MIQNKRLTNLFYKCTEKLRENKERKLIKSNLLYKSKMRYALDIIATPSNSSNSSINSSEPRNDLESVVAETPEKEQDTNGKGFAPNCILGNSCNCFYFRCGFNNNKN